MYKYLQRLGASLMVPVAVLPAASILVGIGYWICPNDDAIANLPHWLYMISVFLNKSGDALISNMGLLFAVGIAYGMSKDKNGAAALTGLVGWLVVQSLLDPESISKFANIPVDEVNAAFTQTTNQFIGILIGIISSVVYNLTSTVQLPSALSFFSGRRLSAIVNSFLMMLIAAILAVVWPMLYSALISFGEMISSLGNYGAGLFGFFNRLLIPTGLHHALNSVFWFDVAGINDIPNYLAGKGTPGVTGMYQAGFFPIMMFALPAAAFAMYREAHEKNKKKILGLLLGGAVTAFFTGVTEPLEFSFMFVAPALYFIHAVLTGISLFVSASLQWISGFGFSAGFIDYFLSFKNPMAVNNVMLILQGIVFAAIYFFGFTFAIRKFNILTPGRGEILEDDIESNDESDKEQNGESKYVKMANSYIELIGKENLLAVDNCTTRLRLTVSDSSIYDEAKFKKVGAMGVMKPGPDSLQIIVGTDVQFVADELKKLVD